MTKHTRDTFLVVTICIIVLILLFITRKKELHEYATDPPTEQGYYLTWITVKKTVLKNQGDTAIVQDISEGSRWEVLEFNPELTKLPKWNMLHLGDWEVDVLYWAELPPEPH